MLDLEALELVTQSGTSTSSIIVVSTFRDQTVLRLSFTFLSFLLNISALLSLLPVHIASQTQVRSAVPRSILQRSVSRYNGFSHIHA